jgi:hypothetical protein
VIPPSMYCSASRREQANISARQQA